MCCVSQHVWLLAAAEELHQGLHGGCTPLLEACISAGADVDKGGSCHGKHVRLVAAAEELHQGLHSASSPLLKACISAVANVAQGASGCGEHVWLPAAAEELYQGLHSGCSPLLDACISARADVGQGLRCMLQHAWPLAAAEELNEELHRAGVCGAPRDVRAARGAEVCQGVECAHSGVYVASIGYAPHERVHGSVRASRAGCCWMCRYACLLDPPAITRASGLE
jgi:hypothetical protein